MNIFIVGGGKKVDFLVHSLLAKKHKITVIIENEGECKKLANENNVQIVLGDGSKMFILEDAGIRKADLIIALTSRDADNLVICQLAKQQFGVKRAFATVNNPKNVTVFKKLGINTAISATYVMARIIEQMASIDEIVNYMPVEDGKIQFIELIITSEHRACGKQLSDIGFPKNAIVGCIIRNGTVFVPNGNSKVRAGDKLAILADDESQNLALEALVGSGSK